MIENSRENY